MGALHSVHDELGPGINEYCYQEALAMELSDRGIPFEREKSFRPRYKGRPMDAEYRIDFLCKGDFYPKFATIERYFYDTDNREILTSDGNPFQGRQMGTGELARAPKASCFK